MNGTNLSPALRSLLREHPPMNAKAIMDDAVETAWSLPRFRSDDAETPGEVISRLRKTLAGEVVAFHKTLTVTPLPDRGDGTFRIAIPLTLFPKRNQGFTHVECAVEFTAENGGAFRVIDALPEEKHDVLAAASTGAELQVEAAVKAGVPMPIPAGSTVATASAKVYGNAKASFDYSVERAAVTAEVLRGVGAAWRLERPGRPRELAAESHQLAVIVEAAPGTRLGAAGYVKAYSEVQWLSASVGDLLELLGDSFRRFMKAGAPVEAFGEWRDVAIP